MFAPAVEAACGGRAPAGESRRPEEPRRIYLNCPHCSNPIEVIENEAADVVCPSCGSSLQLDLGRTKTWVPTRAPRRLGKFEFLEPLGVGTFGSVYQARDTELAAAHAHQPQGYSPPMRIQHSRPGAPAP